MDCDLCGRTGEMYRAIVEDSAITVCHPCTKYGEVTGRVMTETPASKPKKQQPKVLPREEMELFVSKLGTIIKKKREQLGLNQKQFAGKIGEKESILKKIETGQLFPTMEKARKLERNLGIKLIEEVEDTVLQGKKESDNLTLGDFVKIKKRNRI